MCFIALIIQPAMSYDHFLLLKREYSGIEKHFKEINRCLCNTRKLRSVQKQLLEVFCKSFLKKFANFTAKHLYWSLFLINLQAFRPRTPRIFSFLKKIIENCLTETGVRTSLQVVHLIISIKLHATNTTLNAKINEIKNEIPSITNLATTASFNAKISEFKNKIPNITYLATTTALTAIENKIPGHSKYITSPEFYRLTAENVIA